MKEYNNNKSFSIDENEKMLIVFEKKNSSNYSAIFSDESTASDEENEKQKEEEVVVVEEEEEAVVKRKKMKKSQNNKILLPPREDGVMTPGFRSVNNSPSLDVNNNNATTTTTNITTTNNEGGNEWSRPKKKLIQDVSKAILTATYDGDSDDEEFCASVKKMCRAAHNRMLSLEELETIFEDLERRHQVFTHKMKIASDMAEITKKNAITISKSEYVIAALQRASSNIDNLIQEANNNSKSKANNNKSKETTSPTFLSVTDIAYAKPIIAKLTKRDLSDLVIPLLHKYWLEKRKKNGELIHFNPSDVVNFDDEDAELNEILKLDDKNNQRVDFFETIKDFREHVEKIRLIADTARRREKIKKELLELES